LAEIGSPPVPRAKPAVAVNSANEVNNVLTIRINSKKLDKIL
jgi:hypothetical protein